MYRERIHITVTGMDGWNEVIDAIAELNRLTEQKGNPTSTVWTETVGVVNHLVAEIDYDSLAAYEKANRDFFGDPEVIKQLQRISQAAVQGKTYTELLETTGAL